MSSSAPAKESLQESASAMLALGWQVSVVDTRQKGHARRLARMAAKTGVSVVFACGGDGTANEVANGLAGTQTALALIHGGLTNVLAKELGVPSSPQEAIQLLTEGEIRRIDVGTANGRKFLLQVGIGFDADIIRSVSPDAKRTWGKAAFVMRGLNQLLQRHAEPTEISVDGEPKKSNLFWLVLANTPNYAGLRIARDGVLDDGRLDAFTLEGDGPLHTVTSAAKVILNRTEEATDLESNQVEHFQLEHLVVETPGLAVHADGEDLGDTPMTFGVQPKALRILLPPEGGAHLFGSQPDEASQALKPP